MLLGTDCNGVYIWTGARWQPFPFLLQRLPFSSDCHSPATTILQRPPFSSDYHSPATTVLQRLPFSSAYHSPATTILQHLNGHLWHLNGQPQEPEMEVFWSLKLLPIVPNVAFSGYGFVPLLPGARTATLCGKNSLELGSCNA